MRVFFKQTADKWWDWAVKNPQKVFVYSMVFLTVS